MLKSFNLKPGPNTVEFLVESAFLGQQKVKGRIYCWPRNSRIIVSDIDGTITKYIFNFYANVFTFNRSDCLGILMPIIGKDWSHPGICAFYQNIQSNGYQFMYLTSRTMGWVINSL